MKTNGTALYYSTLPNDTAPTEKAETTPTKQNEVHPSRSLSPRRTIGSASSSLSSVVATSVNSAKKITDRALSLVPRKLCTPVTISRNRLGDLDEITAVIYYPDTDAVIKPVSQDLVTLVDPFSFEDSDLSPDKEDSKDSKSPTSVVPVRLFPDDFTTKDLASIDAEDSREEEEDLFGEVVTFDCPIFTNDFKFNEEDSSFEFSEAIKSINAVSIKEETKSYLESIRANKRTGDKPSEAWQEHVLSWDGFTRVASFNTCEWDPKLDLAETASSDEA